MRNWLFHHARDFWHRRLAIRVLCLIAIAMVACLTAIMMRPARRYDWNHVHGMVRELPRPYREVTVEEWLDGGSIGICIVDAKGHASHLVLLVEARSGGNRYERLGRLAQKGSVKDMTMVPLSTDTRDYLVQVVQAHRGTNGEGDLALINLRGWSRDYVNAWVFLFLLHMLNTFALG